MDPGAQLNEEQRKWNAFVASLTKQAGLPSTTLVRLSYVTSEEDSIEIPNHKELNKISKQFGNATQGYITMTILIEVLALDFEQFGKRFKYEYDRFIEKNQSQEMDKDLISQFKLEALTSTTAIIRQKRIDKPKKQDPKPESVPVPKESEDENKVVDPESGAEIKPNPVTDEPEAEPELEPEVAPIQEKDEDEKLKENDIKEVVKPQAQGQDERPSEEDKKEPAPEPDLQSKPKQDEDAPKVASVVCIQYNVLLWQTT